MDIYKQYDCIKDRFNLFLNNNRNRIDILLSTGTNVNSINSRRALFIKQFLLENNFNNMFSNFYFGSARCTGILNQNENIDNAIKYCIKFSLNDMQQNKQEVEIFNKYNKKYNCLMDIFDYDKNSYSSILCEAGEEKINCNIIKQLFQISSQRFLEIIYEFEVFCINNKIKNVSKNLMLDYINNYSACNNEKNFLLNIFESNEYKYIIVKQILNILITEARDLDIRNIGNWMLVKRIVNGRTENFITNVDFGYGLKFKQ